LHGRGEMIYFFKFGIWVDHGECRDKLHSKERGQGNMNLVFIFRKEVVTSVQINLAKGCFAVLSPLQQ